MNLNSETSMSLRSNRIPSSLGLNLESSNNSQRSRLPQHLDQDLIRLTPDERTLPTFVSSPSRFIQQLPESPASLLLNPLVKRFDYQQTPNPSANLSNPNDERNLAEQVDNYFLRRRQYLQHNISVSLNISKWLLENIVFYSVETVRRQAQIQSQSSRAYLTPLSALRMIYTMKQQQGLGVLWKGCFSSLIVTSCETLSNNLIDEIASFDRPSFRIKHILLKTINSCLIIPMYSVHLLRSIQSDLTIVNNWSPLTIFIEPFQRIFGAKTGFYARALPVWYLIMISVPYFVGRHVLQYYFNNQFLKLREKYYPLEKQTLNEYKIQFETVDDIECKLIDTIPNLVNRSFVYIEANIFSVFLSTFLLYPYETVLNRLFVQGTRTIIDDLDKTSVSCVPINTRYLNVFDCCRTIIETEGRLGRGFFKGIGFLILKFGLIYASAHCLKFLIERLAILYTQNTSELSKFHQYVASKQQQEPEQAQYELQQ